MSFDNNFTEDSLIQGCIKGNRESQKLLYQRYAKDMFGICKGYTSDIPSAKDILQDSFIKVFKYIKDFRGGSLEGWIRCIVINTAIDFYRKSIREMNVVELEDHISSVDSDILEQLSVEYLLKLVQRLPEGARLIFNLYTIEGYSHKEISKKLNISIGTSKSQFNRARNLLQKWILQSYDIKSYEVREI